MTYGGFFMRQFQKISIIVLPCLVSIALTRFIIVYGPELRILIGDTVFKLFSTNLVKWELDHAAFGFSLGIPMLLFTLFLLSIRYYSFLRMIFATVLFHIIQFLVFMTISYMSVDVMPLPYADRTYIFFPDEWFVNSALIMASFISCGIILGSLFILKFSQQRSEHKTIDQIPN